jgi:NADH-quinone oxidoreductase subunit E
MAVRRLAEHQPDRFAFSPDNVAWAERTIRKFPDGRQASAVIPLLWRAQEQEGWLTKAAMESVAAMLQMPLIRVLEVATFYTMFHLEPVGAKAHVQVCGTTPCMLSGAGDIIAVCRSRIHDHPHHRSADGAFSWEEAECLGACVNAPLVQIGKDTYEDLTPESFGALLDAFARGEAPRPGPQNGRHYSTPITGLTSLTEIEGAAADEPVPQPDNSDLSPSGSSEAVVPDHGAANLAPDEPRTAVAETAGGEQSEDEMNRRKGHVPEKDGGADPAGPGTAGQKIGRPDSTGRADEAASQAMSNRTEEDEARLPEESTAEIEDDLPGGHERDRPGPRSDRDSPRGDREG